MTTIHKNTYSSEEIDAITRQLEAITVSGKRVFNVKQSLAPSQYHVIYLDTGVELQTLEFRKAREEVSNEAK